MIDICAKNPLSHDRPVYAGRNSEELLGIKLNEPYTGEVVTIKEDEVPVFTACSGMIWDMLPKAKEVPLAIMSAGDGNLVMDILNEELSIE